MSKDQVVGVLILAVSLLGIAAYGWLVFFTNFAVVNSSKIDTPIGLQYFKKEQNAQRLKGTQ